jgi:hypothetical protein
VTRRKSQSEQRVRTALDVVHAYQAHYGSTTQREQAAADLGLELRDFIKALEFARKLGFDVEARP